MLLALVGGVCAAVVGYLLQNNIELLREVGVTGLFVPDAVALRDTAKVFWEIRFDLNATWRPIIGVMLLYGVGVFWGALAVCGLNILLIVIAAYYFLKVIKFLVNDDRYLLLIFFFVMISVVGNIYLIEVMAFPNKEIPLMAITNAYMYHLTVRRNYILALVLSFIAITFRDGYGLILIGCMGVVWGLQNRPTNARVVLVASIAAILSLFPISNFVEFSSILERNTEVSLESSGYFSYFSKLVYNTVSLGLLNSFKAEDGRLYLLNVGFWQFGVFIISGVLWALKGSLRETTEVENNISMIIIITLLGISYGSYIQPRYLMPLLYFFVFGFVRCIGGRRIALLSSIAIPVILLLSHHSVGVSEVGNDVSWSW